jgi:hypothetical protein
MRENGAELRLVRRACSRLHLDQIRPHGLDPSASLIWHSLALLSDLKSFPYFDDRHRGYILNLVGHVPLASEFSGTYSRIRATDFSNASRWEPNSLQRRSLPSLGRLSREVAIGPQRPAQQRYQPVDIAETR